MVIVAFIQGFLELVGLGAFLVGYFTNISWLMIIGGLLIILDDIILVIIGALKPIFPIFLAIVLAIILSPWYVGIFWASAVFKVLEIHISFKKLFTPRRFAHGAMSRARFF